MARTRSLLVGLILGGTVGALGCSATISLPQEDGGSGADLPCVGCGNADAGHDFAVSAGDFAVAAGDFAVAKSDLAVAAADLASRPDPCTAATSGNGDYCGASLPGGVATTLYNCENKATTSKVVCPMGCAREPANVNDNCTTPASYHLPWACGVTYSCTQGNNQGDHVGVQVYSFDFGLPRHTALRPIRGGVVTVAANVVGPGQMCYDGCPYPFGSPQFTNCCNACLNTSNHVNIQHSDLSVATYWHMDVVTVKYGQYVNPTDVIGYSGTSGCSTGPHVHMQLMGNCPSGYCQSVPLSFLEAGVPATGKNVTSQNCP